MIPSLEAARAVNYHRRDALVVATSDALRHWSLVSDRRDLDVDLKDCMDRAPAVGLGLALAQPESKVMVLDCDATLRTDLGGLATIGESRPHNLVHFVFDDASHHSTEGMPVRGLDNIDFAAMARSAGYLKTYRFDYLEDLLIGLEEVMVQPGPVFVLLKVLHDAQLPDLPQRSMAKSWATVRRTLLARAGERG